MLTSWYCISTAGFEFLSSVVNPAFVQDCSYLVLFLFLPSSPPPVIYISKPTQLPPEPKLDAAGHPHWLSGVPEMDAHFLSMSFGFPDPALLFRLSLLAS